MVIDERTCIRCGICVDWCPTECLTMDHFRLTPADVRESVDLAIVAEGEWPPSFVVSRQKNLYP
jgi:formate hydrogenlyase subunit 6/NADH:ubiquinone oxidoreductase subunit I